LTVQNLATQKYILSNQRVLTSPEAAVAYYRQTWIYIYFTCHMATRWQFTYIRARTSARFAYAVQSIRRWQKNGGIGATPHHSLSCRLMHSKLSARRLRALSLAWSSFPIGECYVRRLPNPTAAGDSCLLILSSGLALMDPKCSSRMLLLMGVLDRFSLIMQLITVPFGLRCRRSTFSRGMRSRKLKVWMDYRCVAR
jgi:hypothetical protein